MCKEPGDTTLRNSARCRHKHKLQDLSCLMYCCSNADDIELCLEMNIKPACTPPAIMSWGPEITNPSKSGRCACERVSIGPQDNHTSFSTFMKHEFFEQCWFPVPSASAAVRTSQSVTCNCFLLICNSRRLHVVSRSFRKLPGTYRC